MKALCWCGKRKVHVENVPDPKIIDPHDAIVKTPTGAMFNKGLTIRTGQTHVQRYMRPLLERIQKGEIDPSFVITHRLPLDQAAEGYDIFSNKQDRCIKVVLKP